MKNPHFLSQPPLLWKGDCEKKIYGWLEDLLLANSSLSERFENLTYTPGDRTGCFSH